MFTHGSLFSGIGGFDLGFERAGFRTVWQVEIDSYCRKVLEKHFPHAQRFGDIKDCRNLPAVDVISGGFPCQDISNAGKRVGIDGERSGLWSEMWRVIREVRPRFVVVENVAALLGRGMERVLGDLASGGYDAEWDVLPASAFGAPHIRERVFIVAYSRSQQYESDSSARQWTIAEELFIAYAASERGRIQLGRGNGADGADSTIAQHDGEKGHVAYASGSRCSSWEPTESTASFEVGWIPESSRRSKDVAYAISSGLEERSSILGNHGAELQTAERSGMAHAGSLCSTRRPSDSRETYGRESYGEPAGSSWWATEPDVGRVAHGIPSRVDRLKGLGNAVVPQIAEWIAQRIKKQLT